MMIVFLIQRSVVEVQWVGNLKRNIYRLGHRGKVSISVDHNTCSMHIQCMYLYL